MKPVKQRYKHDPQAGIWGDCHRAAIATILAIPLDDVPHFMDQGAPGLIASAAEEQWLRERGLTRLVFAWPGQLSLEGVLDMVANLNGNDLVFILAGRSANGHGHAVVAGNGTILWDPSLDDAGIVGPLEDGMWWTIFFGAACTRISSPLLQHEQHEAAQDV